MSAVIARWALIEASDEAVFTSIVLKEGGPYVAWLTLMETYAPNTFLSQQNVLQDLVNTVPRRNEDQIEFLTRLETATLKLQEVSWGGPMARFFKGS